MSMDVDVVEMGSGRDAIAELLEKRAAKRISRRSFFATSGMAAGGLGALGLAGCNNGLPQLTVTPSSFTEVDVLNFALNLEYLEASFYLYIATGAGLSSTDMGSSPGAVTGNPAKISFADPNVTALANQLAADEQAHVEFLRTVISTAGATPVSMPALNLSALGSVTNDATFLATARQLETVGVSAYEGGITYFVADAVGLTYAAQVHDTEAQHEATLRQFCIAKGITSAAVDANDKPPVIGAIFNTNSSGLNTVRTPSQVLQIVYAVPGQTGVSSGGFYPAGMNGNVKTT